MAAPGVGKEVSPPSSSLRPFFYLTGALVGATLLLWVRPLFAPYLFSSSYLPQVYCYLGNSSLVWTHAAADTAMGIALLAISCTLAYVAFSVRHEIQLHWLSFAVGLFLIACAVTHFMDVVTIWIPFYVLSGGAKIVAATASLAVAAMLPFAAPRMISLVHKGRIHHRRQAFMALAIGDPYLAHAVLEQSSRILESRVQERTAELERANLELRTQIEERKRAELRLAQIASIVESSDDAIIAKDMVGKIISWNQGAERLYGYTAEEVIGKPISILLPPNAIDDASAILKVAGRGQVVEHYETVRAAKDGRLLDMSLTVSPVRDASGTVVGASSIGRDITARTRAEMALRDSEAQYRMLFDSCPLPMWVIDRKTYGFLAVNEAAVRHYGYTREEFLAMNVLDIRPPEDIPAVLLSLAKRGEGLSEVEVWHHRKKDGSLIRVEITSHPVTLGGVDAELVLAHDITQRLEYEEKLQQSEERFSKAFRAMPMALTISTAAETRYLDANDAFVRLMGYEREQLIGKRARDLQVWADPSDRVLLLAELEKLGRAVGMQTRFRTRSGEIKEVELSVELVRIGVDECFLAITHDVTESKRLEQQLRQAQKMEAVGRLAGGVAHDFNNMLGVILGYSELVEDNLDLDHPARPRVEQIRKAAQRAAALTRQLLAFSRQQVLKPTVLNLNAVVNNISKMLVRLVGEDVSLHFVPGTTLGSVRADMGQIEQVLMNLAVNARDAMPQGGKITIETANAELDESYAHQRPAVRPGAYVALSVTDTGCGMDDKTVLRIFEPFFTTKDPGKGTGLGLSTVYGIVKQSEGYVWVYSEPGKGTSFKIYLPRVDEPAESLLPDKGSRQKAAGGTETVLLVEDDESLRTLALKILEDSGYKVLAADDPHTAIQLSNQHKERIDLLITDVIMPVMSGNELAKFLSTSRAGMKVIYISGYTGDVIARHGVLDEDTHLLEKPFTRNSFLTKVRQVLEGNGSTGKVTVQ